MSEDSGNGRVALGKLEEAVDTLKEQGKDMERRIRNLEGFRWQILGALLLIQGVGVVVILTAVKTWLK